MSRRNGSTFFRADDPHRDVVHRAVGVPGPGGARRPAEANSTYGVVGEGGASSGFHIARPKSILGPENNPTHLERRDSPPSC